MLDGRKTVSAVNPYALYDYLITRGWENDPTENSASESPVLKAPSGSYKVLVPLDMQRTDYEQRLRDALETLCSSRRHQCAIFSERSYTGRQHPQRASPEPRKVLFLKLAKTRVCVAVAFWLLSDEADSALIRARRIRQASAQNATRSDVNCL